MNERHPGQIILDQIMRLDYYALASWGMKPATRVLTTNGIQFDIIGRPSKRVTINIDRACDLYIVETGRVRNLMYKTLASVRDVHVENLVTTIDKLLKE